MVHLRLNESEPNPNPHVNFITALHVGHAEDKEAARQLLRALAAQVRPIMKSQGFVVNSLEEYEYNTVFSGRNWNHGETVELVLRRPNGSFFPTYWLISVFCHELAHIKHMNHGPGFQALWRQLRAEVRALQDKDYYGDGYWSSGRRLADSARVAGDGIDPGDLPEFMCGGAQTRTRPTSIRRRRGERTSIKRKRRAGTRVNANAFVGQGCKLSEDTGGLGTGFGKQAKSKRAREERALAAEKRLQALQASSTASTHVVPKEESSETEEETDSDIEIAETDTQRRQALLNSGEQDNDIARLDRANSWKEFQREFDFGSKSPNHECDIPVASGSTFTTKESKPKSLAGSSSTTSKPLRPSSSSYKGKAPTNIGAGKLVQTDIKFRKKEAIEMSNGGRTLADSDDEILVVSESKGPTTTQMGFGDLQWECLVCTLLNQPTHLACFVCGTTRGENTWQKV
ncbi:hypothetical protein M378DRAFT_159365 [Amanita muscaria Koide BX008]|uniref:WLM-domain-containing protein n=1 Tax=Amanita muscaria (strain Koide BX008) TaxID=946122 RepID=A0A0C2XFD2_AMAMK|nr:hypothetical protein M378DRAFT_159365 [Amanita muscaria Koide BX008]